MGGETAISYMSLSQYARDHGIGGTDFHIFLTLMTAVDAEWLEHLNREAKKREGEKK